MALPYWLTQTNKNDAKGLLVRIYSKKEEITFNSFKLAPLEPPETKRQAADNYVGKYPNGKHFDEVSKWMEANDNERIIADNQNQLDNLVTRWKTLENGTNTDDIKDLIGKAIDVFKYPFAVTDDQKKQRDTIIAAATSQLAELNWLIYERQVRDTLHDNNIGETLKLLPGGKSSGEKWKALCEEVLKQVPSKIDACVRTRGSDFQVAVDDVEAVCSTIKELNNAGIDGADDLLRILNDKIECVKTDWDKFLYGKVRNYTNTDACDDYLATAPRGSMRNETERYKEWIASNSAAVEDYKKRKQEFLEKHRGEGRVPPYPIGATCWEDTKNGGTLWTSPQFLYKPDQWLPKGTEIHAEDSWGKNKGKSHTIEEVTESDIKEADVPRNIPAEPKLPPWHE